MVFNDENLGVCFYSCGWKNDVNRLPLMFKFADGVHRETVKPWGWSAQYRTLAVLQATEE
jgi:hypothetical protein